MWVCFVTSGCGSGRLLMQEATPTLTLTLPHTFTPTTTNTIPPTLTPTLTVTKLPNPSTTPTYELGLCPVDMSLPGIYFSATFRPEHKGLDIASPLGTVVEIQSPGECEIVEVFIDENDSQGVLVECSDHPLRSIGRIGFAHMNFSMNNFITLEYYGLDHDTFFNADGSAITGKLIAVLPREHVDVHRGDFLGYMGNTGKANKSFIHVHIDIWLPGLETEVNPLDYLACEEK